jgi:hypothetical protein
MVNIEKHNTICCNNHTFPSQKICPKKLGSPDIHGTMPTILDVLLSS